jgi:hypothetical protein
MYFTELPPNQDITRHVQSQKSNRILWRMIRIPLVYHELAWREISRKDWSIWNGRSAFCKKEFAT